MRLMSSASSLSYPGGNNYSAMVFSIAIKRGLCSSEIMTILWSFVSPQTYAFHQSLPPLQSVLPQQSLLRVALCFWGLSELSQFCGVDAICPAAIVQLYAPLFRQLY